MDQRVTNKGRWRMEMSLPWAEYISNVSNWTLVGALIVGALATLGIVLSTNAKEYHWEDPKRQSAERISANEKETLRAIAESERAKEGAAIANKQAADANARASEAQLALERYKAPRTLIAEHQEVVAAAIAPFKGQQYRVAIAPSADDALAFWARSTLRLRRPDGCTYHLRPRI